MPGGCELPLVELPPQIPEGLDALLEDSTMNRGASLIGVIVVVCKCGNVPSLVSFPFGLTTVWDLTASRCMSQTRGTFVSTVSIGGCARRRLCTISACCLARAWERRRRRIRWMVVAESTKMTTAERMEARIMIVRSETEGDPEGDLLSERKFELMIGDDIVASVAFGNMSMMYTDVC